MTDGSEGRERILREATRLFVAGGYRGISMRDIAEAVGLSKAGLYYHFENKEDLFLAILQEHLSQVQEVVERCREMPGTTRQRIQALTQALLSFPPEQSAIIRLASQDAAHLSPAARQAFYHTYQSGFIGQIAGMIEEGLRQGELRPVDPMIATWILLGSMVPFFGTNPERGSMSSAQVTAEIVNIFFDGLEK